MLICGVQAAEFEPDETIVYKTIGEQQLLLHVFKPEGHQPSDQRPVAVFFHGGGWKGGTPEQFFPHCHHLAAKGIVAISAQYRLTKQEGVIPKDCVTDGKSAIRWIRQNAKQLGIDPDQIIAGGGSAGGHVAAATGNTTGFDDPAENLSISSRPNALVLFNPVANNGPGGYGHDRVIEYWESFSPMHNINTTSPPTLIMIGTEDHLIPVDEVKEYQRRMQDAGRRCDIKVYEGQGHGFFNFKKKEYYDKTIAAMDAFLNSLEYLE